MGVWTYRHMVKYTKTFIFHTSIRPYVHTPLRLLAVSFLLILSCLFAQTSHAQSCDSLKFCTFKAITITQTSGKGAQYVDVDTSYRIRSMDTAMTFEAWINPLPQPGKRAFVGGLWGPNKDNNDVWVCYIENNTISFVLSKENSFKGNADNTVASYTLPTLYTKGWTHIACVYTNLTQEAVLYVDGFEVARQRNAAYPIDILKQQESKQLMLQIGSCNSLYDDSVSYRTFRGQIDEVRLWRRSLTANEVRCQRNRSLEGTEKDLELYYRSNDSNFDARGSQIPLCDATGHGHQGRLRSGAAQSISDRTVPATFTVSPAALNASLVCVDDTTFTFTIMDTSFCGNSIYSFVYYGAASLYTISPSSFNLQQNVPQTFTVSIKNAFLTGDISTYIYFVNSNRCGDYKYMLLNVNRSTELSYSKTAVLLDTLFVGCLDKTYSEDSINICNKSNRPLQITSAQLKNPKFSWKPAFGQPNLPITLQPGQCWKLIVRMDANDTTKTQYDTLRITSDDKCPGSGFIPLEGRTQDVIVLMYNSAKAQIKRMDFEAVCPGQISNVQTYQYRSLVLDNIYIDSITFTNPAFYGARFGFPVLLKPKTAYLPTAIRFRPPTSGPFVGQMQLTVNYRGCRIVKTIDLTGTGISVDVKFNSAVVAFGNVTIGKTGALTTNVTCTGKDPRNMSAYLKVGDVFTITANKNFSINSGQTLGIGIQFRPREPIAYVDTLCIFDKQCYGTICIPITGTGVFEQFSFTPPFLNIQNVTGCECKTDSIIVKNISGAVITITNDVLNDPSGKYTLLNFAPKGDLQPNQSFTYRVKYCPNDLNADRADRSYITINLSGGTSYQILLQGTSVIPKLYVTPLVTYGPVEVGWQKDDSLLIENISSVPVHVTTVNVPAGYVLTGTKPPLPVWVQPRDSVIAYIQFKPIAQTTYQGKVVVTLDTPCGATGSGLLTGKGEIIKLEVPVTFINFGLMRPCDCAEREIPIPNASNFIPLKIDSISIVAAGLPNANPSVFKWKSRRTGDSTLPLIIPPGESDTLVISFCPNVPAIPANLTMNAQLTIHATTPAYSQTYKTILSGRREMNFQPKVNIVSFAPTRVDTNAASQKVLIIIPNAFQNPSGDSIVFTGTSFKPDDRVFTVSECSGELPPWVRYRGDTLCLKFDFKPRAPKKYRARLNLATAYPCAGVDTTILVTGEGFAPAYGMQVAFDTSNLGADTLRLTTCDTLLIPIMATKDMPQDIIDMLFRIGYDSLSVKILDVTSAYSTDVSIQDTGDGARIRLKDMRKAKAGVVAYVRFIPFPGGGPKQFNIFLDDVNFDSDSLVSFKIVTGIDRGYVIIDDPQIRISPLANFDTVKIKDCKDQFVTVYNPGAVAILFDSLSTMPRYHRVTASSKPLPTMIAPGDSVVLTVTFCPRREGLIDTSIWSYSSAPCPIQDTGLIHSYGWAPPFPFTMAFDANIGFADTLSGAITDTVEMPIIIDRDFVQRPIDVRFSVNYNQRALKYLSAKSQYVTPDVTVTDSGITMVLAKCDTISKGEIARMRFLMCVPDSVISPMVLVPGYFTSDSLFYVKPVATGDTGMVKVGPHCSISYLRFTGGTNAITIPRPNPTTGIVEMEVEFFEDVAPKLVIYNSTGLQVLKVLDGTAQMKGGRYKLSFDLRQLSEGAYIMTFDAGRFHATEKIILRK